jgi:hypothetical protein
MTNILKVNKNSSNINLITINEKMPFNKINRLIDKNSIFKRKEFNSDKYQYDCNVIHFLFFFLLIVVFYLLFELNYYKNNRYKKSEKLNIITNRSFIINPILPENEKEVIKKKYFKSKYNDSHSRYHFVEDFLRRKLFIINYSYLPYENIDKSKSYEDNANYIYETTGMLNITKLNNSFYNKKEKNTLDFNHIHLSMGHDANYISLSLITIASILNTTNSDTFIHFHIILLGAKFEDMKPIIDLKDIYENVDFIFYNGKQVEYDFSIFGNKEGRGIGDYAKFLIPEIVNNTNKIIILDSADIIAKKDLSEIYFFDLEDNYYGFALDIIAGKTDINFVFAKNKFYANIGCCLVNIRLFRRDKLYMAGYFARYAYSYLPCPTQEMFFLTSQYKFKYLPLIYNYPQLSTNV